MSQAWIVEFAFPFWALVFGYDMYANARRSWKQLLGFLVAAAGGYGIWVLFVSGTLGVPLVTQASMFFVGRYGAVGAFITAGLVVANVLARVGNFPRFKRHTKKLLFALIFVNVFAAVNSYYPEILSSVVASLIISAIATTMVGNYELRDLVDFY
jgi:hypothetical protein